MTLPSGLTSIASGAFRSATKLASITIPSGVTEIPENAFNSCTGLTNVVFLGGITSIGSYAFRSCTGLTEIVFPATLTSIGDYAFDACVKLATANFPASLTTIGTAAVRACGSLDGIAIPAGVTSIGASAFETCASLTAIPVNAANASYSSIDGLLYDKVRTTLIQFPGGKAGEVTIPDSVTTIPISAFSTCPNLTAIQVDPSNVYYTGIDGVLYSLYDKNATTLVRYPGGKAGAAAPPAGAPFPASLTRIGSYSFKGCVDLALVTLPTSITAIGDFAFQSCGNLLSACFLGNAPTTGSSVFTGVAPGFKIYFFDGKSGFSIPTWRGYPSVNMGNRVTPVPPWLLANGLAYNASLSSDPNSDGVSLLMAYALKLDPNKNLSGNMPVPTIVGNQMRLTYYAGSSGVDYIVQRSGNLTDWTTTGVTVSAPDAGGFRTASVDMTEASCVLRIVAKY